MRGLRRLLLNNTQDTPWMVVAISAIAGWIGSNVLLQTYEYRLSYLEEQRSAFSSILEASSSVIKSIEIYYNEDKSSDRLFQNKEVISSVFNFRHAYYSKLFYIQYSGADTCVREVKDAFEKIIDEEITIDNKSDLIKDLKSMILNLAKDMRLAHEAQQRLRLYSFHFPVIFNNDCTRTVFSSSKKQ